MINKYLITMRPRIIPTKYRKFEQIIIFENKTKMTLPSRLHVHG